MRDIHQRLLAVFQVEHKEHVEQIRSLLEHLEKGAGVSPGPELDEVFRRAHSLKGAARAVDLRPVETLAHRLETLFSRVREGALRPDKTVFGVIRQVLDSTEDLVACLGEKRTPADPGPALEAIERVLGMEPDATGASLQTAALAAALESPPIQPIETVRVQAASLDRLLSSSGRLLSESLSQDRVSRQLSYLARDIRRFERDWDRLREASFLPLKRLPELASLRRHLDSVQQQVRSVSTQARGICLLQQRSSWALRHLTEQLQDDVCHARMAPAESAFDGFRKMVRDLAGDEGKQIEFHVNGLDVQADRMVLQALKDPVMHLLRNAVFHGIESPPERIAAGKAPMGLVRLALDARGDRFRILVEDDGRGIDLVAVGSVAIRKGLVSEAEAGLRSPEELARLIFLPGFSTSRVVTELAGRGMGLSVVSEQVKRLQGQVEIQKRAGPGVSILISAPLLVSTQRLLLVACAGQTFGIPVSGIERLCRIRSRDVRAVEGKPAVFLEGRPVGLARLAELLGLRDEGSSPQSSGSGTVLPAVILRGAGSPAAVVVDAFLAERSGLVKDLGIPPSQTGRTAGGLLLEDGSIAVVLNPFELASAFRQAGKRPGFSPAAPAPEKKPPSILVVDDSITTRSLEKSILEAHGYRVRIAVDGMEALAELRTEKADLVIADVQMPRLDGFGLLEQMKKDEGLSKIPVIIVTSLERREDQQRGLALGADAYIVKRKFDQRDLLDTIRQLL